MTIGAANIGSRMVVRHLVPGRGPSGGPAMTDVVGRILALTEDQVSVERRDGTVVHIELDRVVTAKVVPAVPTRSRGALAISSANLAAIMARGGAVAESAAAGAVVQVAMLRNSYAPQGVRIEPGVSPNWLTLYARAGGTEPLGGPATVGFLSIGEPADAIARVAVTGEWAGFSCVYVVPGRRRRGLGTRLLEAGISWARQQGADKAYAPVHPDNEAAWGMLAPFGFRTHPRH